MHSNGKILFLDEIKVYQSFYNVPLTFSSFSSRKISCVSACVCKLLAKCSLSEGPCWKNDISGFIWHKSFIQTVKCSSFNQRIVYQSFYGALPSLNYFSFKGKFVFCHALASRSQDVYHLKRSEDLVEKMISPLIFDSSRSFKRYVNTGVGIRSSKDLTRTSMHWFSTPDTYNVDSNSI